MRLLNRAQKAAQPAEQKAVAAAPKEQPTKDEKSKPKPHVKSEPADAKESAPKKSAAQPTEQGEKKVKADKPVPEKVKAAEEPKQTPGTIYNAVYLTLPASHRP